MNCVGGASGYAGFALQAGGPLAEQPYRTRCGGHGLGYNPEAPRLADVGNDLADDVAKAGARLHGVGQQAADQQLELEAMAEDVLIRLVTLEVDGCRKNGDMSEEAGAERALQGRAGARAA